MLSTGDEAAAGTGALTETIELCARDGADGPTGCASWGEDTYLDEGEPTTPHGMEPVLLVSALGAGTPAPPRAATLIRFDVAHIRDDVLRGGTVSSAAIWLYSEHLEAMGCYSVTDPGWTEDDATWETAPGAGTLLSFHHDAGAGWAKFEVTGEIRRMLEGGDNHGFRILGSPVGGRTDFNSRESGSPNRPRLELSIVPADFIPVEPTPPPLDRSAPTTVYDAMNFLLDPALGLQPGVVATGIDRDRAAVIRGHVYDRATELPLAGVRVRVLGHPEYGAAITRRRLATAVPPLPAGPTGDFEIILNGGGPITLEYDLDGYLRAQRTIDAAWNDWTSVPDVALMPLESLTAVRREDVAEIDSSGGVFVGPPLRDCRGSRQIVFYVPPGTSVAHDGGTLPTYVIRAGEYTHAPLPTSPGCDGERDGAELMPVELPETTSFTYAAALEVSATVAGSFVGHPRFGHPDPAQLDGFAETPVYFYLRVGDFIDSPPGEIVPNGLYERDRANWTADLNGIAVEVTRTTSGDCTLSTGTAPNPVPSLEVTAICAEDAFEAGRYWRVPMDRFSVRDANWPADLSPDGAPEPEGSGGDTDRDCSGTAGGSVVYCESQALGEVFPITGSAFNLAYLSDRQAGRRERYRVAVTPLPIAAEPRDPFPISVQLELRIAGRVIPVFATPTAGEEIAIAWDGLDAYGREVVGPRRGFVRVGYEFRARYSRAVSGYRSFGMPSRTPSNLTSSGTVVVWRTMPVTLGTIDDRVTGIGGWGIAEHHFYDPTLGTLYLGNGSRRSAESTSSVMRIEAEFIGTADVSALTRAPDGTLYFFDRATRHIRRYAEGVLDDIGADDYDAVLALAVGRWFDGTRNIDVLYAIADRSAGASGGDALYRVGLGGEPPLAILQHRLGGAQFECSAARPPPDCIAPGSPVRAADFNWGGVALAVASDGSVFTGGGGGIVRYSESSGEPLVELVWPASSFGASAAPAAMTIARDGTLYWVGGSRIFALHPDGSWEVVLQWSGESLREGAPVNCVPSDEPCASVGTIHDVMVDPDDNVCFLESPARGDLGMRVRCVRGGEVFTVAGVRGDGHGPGYVAVDDGRRGPATRIRLVHATIVGAEYAPDGRLYMLDNYRATTRPPRLWVVEPAYEPDLSVGHLVPSADGSVFYAFNPVGRHLRTLDTITGARLVEFHYDRSGRLMGLTDAEGTTTDVSWGAAGDADPHVLLVAPGDVTTRLDLNPDGYVSELTDPANSTWTFHYYTPATPGGRTFPGLMTRMDDALGGRHRFTYDTTGLSPTGRLLSDEDTSDSGAGDGPVQSLTARTRVLVGGVRWDSVTLVAPEDPELPDIGGAPSPARETRFLARGFGGGGAFRVVGSPLSAGGVERMVIHGDAFTRIVAPADGAGMTATSWDGSEVVETMEPDPRPELAAGARFPASTTATRPSGVITAVERTFQALAGGVLEATAELPPAAPTLAPSTTRTRIEPVSSGFLTTVTPPTGMTMPPTTTDRVSRLRTDAFGRTTRIESPGVNPTCVYYANDLVRRPSHIRQAPLDGDDCSETAERREVSFAYDAGSELRWLTSVTTGTGSGRLITEIDPDVRGWPEHIAVPHPIGTARADIDIEYDAHGNITSFRPPGREPHEFGFTHRDLLETYTPPPARFSGPEIERSEYRPDGSLRTRTFRSRAVLTTALNPVSGYLRDVTVSGDVAASWMTFFNDDGGRPERIETNMGDLAFEWDGPVLETETWTPRGSAGVAGELSRSVGASMLLDVETASIGAARMAVAYTYDADRLLVSARGRTVPEIAGAHLSYAFSPTRSMITRIGRAAPSAGLDITTTTAASGLGELRVASTVRGSDVLHQVWVCARDEHGRITERTEVWGERPQVRMRQYSYRYDERGFLSSSSVTRDANRTADPCAPLSGPRTTSSWTYDDAGNRRDLAFNAEDQVTTGGRTYDALGHLSTLGERTYRYDVLGRLRSTSGGLERPEPPRRPPGRPRGPPGIPPGLASGATYDYDALGRLVAIHGSGRSDAGEQRFIYRDGLNPIAWSRPNDTGACRGGLDTLFFVYASMPDTPDLAYVDACSNGNIDATWRYLSDERGSVRFVIDVATGEPAQEITYDAWGLPTFGISSASIQPFGYIGGIYDAETGFWRLGARDYDPRIGRWTTKDPIGFAGGMNLYAYCMNDPVNCTDVTGLYSIADFAWDLDRSGTAGFAAGFGDSLSFGLTRIARDASGNGGGGVDPCSEGYAAGEATELAMELALMGGSAYLRGLTRGLSRAAVRRAGLPAVAPIRAPGRFVHHINTLFGHPSRALGLFPTGGLRASIHSHARNLVSVTREVHTGLHRQAAAAEWLVERTLMNPALTAARGLLDTW